MKKILIFSVLFIFSFSVFSQSSSFALGLGGNKMSGDIGSNDGFQNNLGSSFSLGYRYIFPFNLGFRVFGSYDNYHGKDTEAYNNDRKHFFSSQVTSVGGQLELVFMGNDYENDRIPHSLYLFGGGETAFYNALLDGSHTEKGNSIGVFAGIGYQYRFSDYFSLGLEMQQILYLSDKIDAYYPDIASNKYQDTAFKAKLVLSFYIPLYSFPRHWYLN